MIDFQVSGFDKVRQAASGLRKAAGIVGQVSGLSGKAGPVILKYAKAEAPKKTGRSASLLSFHTTGTGGSLNGPLILGMLRHGTRPHIIRPRNAKALHFTMAGGDVFATIVHHPGTKPNDWLKRAVDKAKPEIRTAMRAQGTKIIQTIKGG